MPELPEVETVKKVLEKVVISHKIIAIDVLRDSIIDGDITTFKNALINQTFLNIERKGKFLIFHLTNDVSFLSHLRMEGKYYEIDEHLPNSRYARVVFHLDNHKKVCYDDSRTFGKMKITNKRDYLLEKELQKLGPESFDVKDISSLMKKTKNSKLPIKSTLLDQTLMSGLGNIYADEVLFACGLHPLTPTNLITLKMWENIVKNAQIILNNAINDGGSTIKSYHPGKDISGNFQTRLKAYGKRGLPCINCGHIMHFIKVNGRGTTYCPICQKRNDKHLRIGLTGKIAAGKTTALNIFKNNNFFAISSDEIVSNLYQRKDVVEKINQLFNLHFKDKVDKDILRNYLVNNPLQLKTLNNLVWPLVRDEIISFMNLHKTKDIIVEVPLLYESKMDDLFDFIIAIDIDEEVQLKRLKARDLDKAKVLKNINQNNAFNKYKEKVDFVLLNNNDLPDLKIQINNIINKLR